MREAIVIGSGAQPSSPTSAQAPGPAADRGLCAFWLAGRCFGLDIRGVGEVVALDAITRVPDARPAVRGLFNLRGEPVVVLDLASILDLGDAPPSGKLGLVLRMAGLTAVIQVERVESIVPPGRGEFAPRSDGEHRAVVGLLDDRSAGGRIVTVLDSELLLERLQALRYLTDADD
jgi:purine-binding chemotaxis protein CheW